MHDVDGCKSGKILVFVRSGTMPSDGLKIRCPCEFEVAYGNTAADVDD
jgi:hypothetical protein